ncbi:MAG TPA: hypothetical protein VM711_04185 [Sphingomicrobium sp.]|nr:hypothetical protein [Sphingomicrobium sp.]
MPSDLDIIEQYVAVWNEADPDCRRERIRSVWAPDGSTCYRLLDAHGYDAIEERVRASWDRWLRDGKYTFRPKQVAAHHDAIRFDFALVTLPEGEVEANGLSFLLLNSDGRLQRDYQFNPSADEQNDIVDRYLAVLNEPDPMVRRRQIAELWMSQGMFVSQTAMRKGHAALQAEAAAAHHARLARGRVYRSAHRTQAHHNVIKFTWRVGNSSDAEVCAAGTELLILERDGRIGLDYSFDEAV